MARFRVKVLEQIESEITIDCDSEQEAGDRVADGDYLPRDREEIDCRSFEIESITEIKD